MTRDEAAWYDPEILFADGFDEALMGIATRCGQPTVACYDYAQCVAILEKRDGMSHEEAVEWMEYNVVGAWLGPRTPFFVKRGEDEDPFDAIDRTQRAPRKHGR